MAPGDNTVAVDTEVADLQTRDPSLKKDAPSVEANKEPFMQQKYHLFHDELAGIRKKIWYGFFRSFIIIGVGLLCICSIYWGSYYKRTERAHNLTAYVLNFDGVNSTYLQDNGLEPYIGYAVGNATQTPVTSRFLGWKIFQSSEIDHPESYYRHQVHEQHIWVSCAIHADATETLHKALVDGDSAYNGTGLVECYFEQSTDYLTSMSLVQQGLSSLQQSLDELLSIEITQKLLDSLTSSQKSSILTAQNKTKALTSPITIRITDGLPLKAPILVAPLQVGLIYLIILSFFQINFFMPFHLMIMPKLKIPSLLLYRFFSAQLGYLMISLFFCLVSVAFQIDYRITFGRSGFLVYWMINYLSMSALGGATENVATVLFSVFPPGLGLWLLFWVISNISPAFSPFALTDKFYRYGYAFPVYNGLELIKVVLCNTTKSTMGRNFGILVAWNVINALLLPFALRFAGPRLAKQKQQEIANAIKNMEAEGKLKVTHTQSV